VRCGGDSPAYGQAECDSAMSRFTYLVQFLRPVVFTYVIRWELGLERIGAVGLAEAENSGLEYSDGKSPVAAL
jgi:hypothetical protein